MTHKEYLKTIGMEFRIARIRQGLSSNDLSKITGMSPDSVLRLENGRSDAKILTMKRVADALGVSLKDIL